MNKLLNLVCLATIVFVLGTTDQSWAGQKGKFRCRAVLVNVKTSLLEIPLDTTKILRQGEWDGGTFNETGESFLNHSRYQIYETYDGVEEKMYGYKIFTMPDSSKIYSKFEPNVKGDKLAGTFTFIGGTGKYKGVKGKGTYSLTIVTATLLWDSLEGEYELP